MIEERPNPDAVLKQILDEKEENVKRKGRLKIFF